MKLTRIFAVQQQTPSRRRFLPAALLCAALAAAAGQLVAAESGAATFMVAADDSPLHLKGQADYVCPGQDDHLVINAAIEALPALGGNVFLSPGTYRIGGVAGTHGGINIFRSNVMLAGAGSATRLIMQDGLTNINAIWISGDNLNDVTIRDLYINGNGKNLTRTRETGWAGCNGVKAMPKNNYPQNIKVENCRIENCRLMAVMLYGDGVEVLNCYFSGYFGSHVVELLGFNGRIEGCTLNVKDGDSVGFGFSTDACNNYQIVNNKVLVAAGGRIESHAINNWRRCYNGIINGNIVINHGRSRSVRIQGVMDMVCNNVFRGVPVEIQGEGAMFGNNILVDSPLEIKACVHENIINPVAPGEQLPIQIAGNWFCASPITNTAGNVIIGANQFTKHPAAGMAVIAGGTNMVAVDHGLAVAPALVHVRPADSASKGMKWVVENITDRQFTLRVDPAPQGAGATFYWRAATQWKDKQGRLFQDGADE